MILIYAENIQRARHAAAVMRKKVAGRVLCKVIRDFKGVDTGATEVHLIDPAPHIEEAYKGAKVRVSKGASSNKESGAAATE